MVLRKNFKDLELKLQANYSIFKAHYNFYMGLSIVSITETGLPLWKSVINLWKKL